MAEIMRAPVAIAIGVGPDITMYDCFDEDHTLADISRWLMRNRVDAEEVHRILGEMLSD